MAYDKKVLARRLKTIRTDLGLEPKDLAELTEGVGVDVIRRAERAEGGMTLDSAYELTVALGCTLDQLVGHADYVSRAS